MSQASTFTTMVSASTSLSPKSSICISSIIMEDSEMIDVAEPGSMSSLSAIAKAITKFLFGEAQLPASLSHFHAFFTGFATGAVTAPILYAFFTRNRADRGKIQLAVFHIMRLFQDRPDYSTLLQDPEKLLQRMEPEVMHMLDKHLTMVEAGGVMKELKRNYAHLFTAEPINKRIKRSPVEAPKVPHLTAVYAPAPRGFLPAPLQDDDDYEPEEVLQEAPKDKGKGRAEPATSPTPPPPQRGGFGLDYEDEVLYPPSPSTSDDDDIPAPPPAPYDNSSPAWTRETAAKSKGARRPKATPPPVVRKLHGVKCSGTSLSPIQGSPSGTEDLQKENSPPALQPFPRRSSPRRSSPLADITATSQPFSPPKTTPMKFGRGRGRTGAAKEAEKQKRKEEEEARTPARRTARQTYQGFYGR